MVVDSALAPVYWVVVIYFSMRVERELFFHPFMHPTVLAPSFRLAAVELNYGHDRTLGRPGENLVLHFVISQLLSANIGSKIGPISSIITTPVCKQKVSAGRLPRRRYSGVGARTANHLTTIACTPTPGGGCPQKPGVVVNAPCPDRTTVPVLLALEPDSECRTSHHGQKLARPDSSPILLEWHLQSWIWPQTVPHSRTVAE